MIKNDKEWRQFLAGLREREWQALLTRDDREFLLSLGIRP